MGSVKKVCMAAAALVLLTAEIRGESEALLREVCLRREPTKAESEG